MKGAQSTLWGREGRLIFEQLSVSVFERGRLHPPPIHKDAVVGRSFGKYVFGFSREVSVDRYIFGFGGTKRGRVSTQSGDMNFCFRIWQGKLPHN